MSQLLQPSATLEEKQPIYKVEQGCLISKNGDVTVAFRLGLPEIYTLAQHDYEALHAALVKAVRLLLNHTVLHKQDWFVEDKYTPCFEQERSLLSHTYERHFYERPFLHHYCYLFITKTASSRENWTSVSTLLSRPKIVPKEMMDEKLLTAFFNSVGQFVRVLVDAGIACTQLTDEDLCGTDEKTGLLEKYLSLNLSDTVPLTDLDFTQGLKVGSKLCQCLSLGNLDDLPAALPTSARHDNLSTPYTNFFVGFTAPVGLSLNCNHIYNQYLFVDDAAKTLKTFEKKRDNLNALAIYSRPNAINKENYDRYLNEAHSEQKLPVRAHANVLAWTEREAEVKEVRERTGSALTLMGCKVRENTVDIGALFWAGIPGNAGDFPSEETFYTFAEQACCLWSLETNYRDSSSPFGIKLSDRLTGKPVHVDISDEPRQKGIIANRNKFVLGGSGSGKSFFTNGMVRQYHEQGSHVLIVDTGNSYKGLCELKKGVYFTYQETKPISFNPFFVAGSPDVEKRLSLHNLLVMLWKRESEDVSQSEYVSISTALTHYYQWLAANSSVKASFNTFYEFLQGPFRTYLDSEKVREQDFDMLNFLYVLKPYYRGGEYDYLLNSDQQLNLTQETFIVFEIDNIKDHPILFPVVTLVIMDTFLQKMRAESLKGVRKMILIEEAWKAIATPAMAQYLKYLFKTVRKFQGEAVVVTQEVKDILDNPVVKDTIITQSDCMILLDLRKFMGRFTEIQEVLALSEKQKALVLSINQNRRPGVRYNEVYIGLGTTVATVYGVEVSKEEYVTYTTEEAEKKVLFDKLAAGMSIETAIQAYAQELREAG